MSTKTSPNIASLATKEAHLPKTALIGIFGPPATLSALILMPKGETRSVKVGDNIGKGTVLAIGKDQVVLMRNGSQHILHLPRG